MATTFVPRAMADARAERERRSAEVEARFGVLFAPVWAQVLEAAARPPYTVSWHGPEHRREAVDRASRCVSWGNPTMDRAWRVYARMNNPG